MQTDTVTLGATPEAPGQTRRTRLTLPPRVRDKLENIEQQAAAAHAEVARLGDLLEAERERLTQLARTVPTWEANYYRDVSKADVAQLQAEQAACDAERARVTEQREHAQQRWQRLNRVAEACRVHLGLPANGRRT